MSGARLVGAATVALLVVCATTANAHTRSVSYSTWRVHDEGAEVDVRLPPLETDVLRAALGPPSDRWIAYASERLQLLADGSPCPSEIDATALTPPPRGEPVVLRWSVVCDTGAALQLRSHLLDPEVPAHVHLASVTLADETVETVVLSTQAPTSPPIGSGAMPAGIAVKTYLLLGVEHIVMGWDHLAFLLALLLVIRRLRDAAWTVTGFTVGHSVTLVAGTVGWASPDIGAVEALIGWSIAFVAATSIPATADAEPDATTNTAAAFPAALVALLGVSVFAAAAGEIDTLALVGVVVFAAAVAWGERQSAHEPDRAAAAQWRPVIAALFGLLHGFGFAGALGDLSLPRGAEIAALASFNLGVELGQIAVVLVVWPALRVALRRLPLLQTGLAAATAGLGTFWFVARTLGTG